ncbi:hypothetical protein B0H17DRAFT_1142324 [Mycena rosella]|uniref:Uncharacterized protein n=1 Tax=Mycena rosella TaxID=1033263 RepID=A0AAD7CXL5_MYCRO|nr:hypothetical protein B0H17DRAFT_1142324 [Mycena rosella]
MRRCAVESQNLITIESHILGPVPPSRRLAQIQAVDSLLRGSSFNGRDRPICSASLDAARMPFFRCSRLKFRVRDTKDLSASPCACVHPHAHSSALGLPDLRAPRRTESTFVLGCRPTYTSRVQIFRARIDCTSMMEYPAGASITFMPDARGSTDPCMCLRTTERAGLIFQPGSHQWRASGEATSGSAPSKASHWYFIERDRTLAVAQKHAGGHRRTSHPRYLCYFRRRQRQSAHRFRDVGCRSGSADMDGELFLSYAIPTSEPALCTVVVHLIFIYWPGAIKNFGITEQLTRRRQNIDSVSDLPMTARSKPALIRSCRNPPHPRTVAWDLPQY